MNFEAVYYVWQNSGKKKARKEDYDLCCLTLKLFITPVKIQVF